MTTCPRCGRVADDEIVCAQCGMSLALVRRSAAEHPPALTDDLGFAEDGGAVPRDVKTWRLAALVGVTCLLAAVVAIVLLNKDGSRRGDLGLPPTSTPAPSPSRTPDASTTSSSVAPTGRTSITPTKSNSKPGTLRSSSTSRAPSRTPSTSHSRASRTSAPPAATRSVHVARGSLDRQCGPHCYEVVVTLSGFPSGTHQVACWAARGGLIARYTTSASTSAVCEYKRPRDSVWAVVDGTYRSNSISW